MQNKKMTPAIIVMVLAALVIAGTAWRIQSIRQTEADDGVQTVQITDGEQAGFHGAAFDPAVSAPNIVLTDHHGDPFQLYDQRGRVVVLFFGFTSCPDVCPATLAHFKQVKQHLQDEADHVRFVMVSVDPERDTPDRMAEYIAAFDPEFIGVTGTVEEAQVAWAAYDVQPEKIDVPGSALGYSVAHPASSYVIDPEGNLRLMHFFGLPADVVAEDLRKLAT